MTEAGKKWLVDKLTETEDPPQYGHMTTAMEFGIRAFCAEVERRAAVLREGDPPDQFWTGHAFDELKRELLG